DEVLYDYRRILINASFVDLNFICILFVYVVVPETLDKVCQVSLHWPKGPRVVILDLFPQYVYEEGKENNEFRIEAMPWNAILLVGGRKLGGLSCWKSSISPFGRRGTCNASMFVMTRNTADGKKHTI